MGRKGGADGVKGGGGWEGGREGGGVGRKAGVDWEEELEEGIRRGE